MVLCKNGRQLEEGEYGILHMVRKGRYISGGIEMVRDTPGIAITHTFICGTWDSYVLHSVNK